MRSKKMTYRKLATMLKAIGFHEKKMKPAYILFSHPKSNAIILLPYYTPNMVISPSHWSMITRTIIEKGVLSEDALDEVIQAGEEHIGIPKKESVFA